VTDTPPKCWGCECNVPLVDGYHEEPTDVPGAVYMYPCIAEDEEPQGTRAGNNNGRVRR
jgi:hypothetical protein